MTNTTGREHSLHTSKRAWLQVAMLVALVALVVWRVDLQEAWDVFTSIGPGYALLGVALLIASNVVHAKKWQCLLEGLGAVRLRDAFAVFWASMTTNSVIPLRAGDVLRVQVLSQRTGMSRPGIVASLFTERLLDGVSFIALTAVALAISGSQNYVNFWLLAIFAVFMAVVVATVIAARSMPGAEIEHSRWLRPLPPRLRHRLAEFLPHVIDGIRPLGQAHSGLQVTGWALLAWSLEGAAFIAWGKAFGLDVGTGALLLVMVAVNFTSSLTVLPANLGIFELTAVGILRATGADPPEATAYAVGTHLLVIATIGLVGVGALLYLRLSPSDVFYLHRRTDGAATPGTLEAPEPRRPASPSRGRR
jgi:uncharacterized protein (TIRG00374 family)